MRRIVLLSSLLCSCGAPTSNAPVTTQGTQAPTPAPAKTADPDPTPSPDPEPDPTPAPDPVPDPTPDPSPDPTPTVTPKKPDYVFVIAMENQDAKDIYGNAKAPYINNTLMKQYAYASSYGDDLPSLPSEPHYVWMNAGTNAFNDATFTSDKDPSAANSTASTAHLAHQLDDAKVSWRSYQEDMPAPCPVKSKHPYAAKHDPFVFFRDVSFTNGQPDEQNAYCAAHHKDFATLAADLAAGSVAQYNFITPNICNDMHGALQCSNGCILPLPGYGACISAGDAWLKALVPSLIAFSEKNNGVIFIVWDEPEATSTAPFLLISPHLDAPGEHKQTLSHSSLVKSVERIFGAPVLPTVTNANDFTVFFQAGWFP